MRRLRPAPQDTGNAPMPDDAGADAHVVAEPRARLRHRQHVEGQAADGRRRLSSPRGSPASTSSWVFAAMETLVWDYLARRDPASEPTRRRENVFGRL